MTEGQLKYERVADELAAGIAGGRWQVGERLPNRLALKEASGVSAGTIDQALKLLQSWGLVSVRQGVGVVVESRERRPVRTTADEISELRAEVTALRIDVDELKRRLPNADPGR